jgi:hypothetical protein
LIAYSCSGGSLVIQHPLESIDAFFFLFVEKPLVPDHIPALALRMPVFDPNKHFTKKIDSQIIENDDVPRFYQMTMQYDIVLAIAFSKN